MNGYITNLLLGLLCVCIEANVITNNTLKLVHMIFRHGERSPTETYNSDPYLTYKWPGGWGALNNNGKLQLYELGTKIRKQYINFLNGAYNPDDVYVLSSYADRCQMSAQCLLAGLYPPKNDQIWNDELLWQPIPVHTIPRSEDNVIAMKRNCTKYEFALKEAYASEYIKQLNENNKNLYEYVSAHAEQKFNTITDLELLFNTLEIEDNHGLLLPAWTNSIYPDKLKILAAESLSVFTQTEYMRRMKGGVLIKDVISHMLAVKGNDSKVKKQLYLYSGHDTTIVNVMRSLGFLELLKPDYGAHIVIELHEIANKHVVKMYYYENYQSETPKLLPLDLCRAPCSLDEFVRVLSATVPENWQRECEMP